MTPGEAELKVSFFLPGFSSWLMVCGVVSLSYQDCTLTLTGKGEEERLPRVVCGEATLGTSQDRILWTVPPSEFDPVVPYVGEKASGVYPSSTQTTEAAAAQTAEAC